MCVSVIFWDLSLPPSLILLRFFVFLPVRHSKMAGENPQHHYQKKHLRSGSGDIFSPCPMSWVPSHLPCLPMLAGDGLEVPILPYSLHPVVCSGIIMIYCHASDMRGNTIL